MGADALARLPEAWDSAFSRKVLRRLLQEVRLTRLRRFHSEDVEEDGHHCFYERDAAAAATY